MRATTVWALAALLATGTSSFGQEEEQPGGDRGGPGAEREQQRERGSRDGDRPRSPDAERSGPRQPEHPGPRGFGPPASPVLWFALDINRDGKLSSDEVSQAVSALKKLDRNEDGDIDREELRPVARPDGGSDREPRGDRPPFSDRRPPADADRGSRDEEDRGPRGDGGDGRPPEADRGPRGETDRGGRGRGPGEFGSPRMDPQRVVDRLMQSDADGDGKLSREELLRAFENMDRSRFGDRGPRPGGSGPDGDRGTDGDRATDADAGADRGNRDDSPERDRDRPQRPE